MINTPRSRLLSQQAYIKKMLRENQRPGTAAGIKQTVQAGTTLFADFIRHAFVMIGIIGLVGIAVGATTECRLYHEILNWISSFLIS